MTKSLSRTLFVSMAGLVAGWFAVAPLAHAVDDADFDIDPKFRAKIAKQKAKQASQQSTQQKNGSSTGDECGTQNIGNVQSGGIGRGPREVFVFAPNSINVVSGSGCK